jgi:AcrR family transcriptional regulator
VGLEGLTVGTLARQVGLSKSGLYAHFKSKEDLQSQVLDQAAELFIQVVARPAFKKQRGLPRVIELFELWIDWTAHLSGGCPFVTAAVEFDDRPGPVRDTVVRHQQDLMDMLAKTAQLSVEEGHFRANLDIKQFAFEFWGILLAYHHYARLMRREDSRKRAALAFERLIKHAQGK